MIDTYRNRYSFAGKTKEKKSFHRSKLEFLAMLFPRLYRSSAQFLPPITNTSVYTLSTTTPSSFYVTTEQHTHHKSQYTPPSYQAAPFNPTYHTTLRPTSVVHSSTASPLAPVTPASSVHTINIGTLSRGPPATPSYASQNPPITYSASVPRLHTPTTLSPPSLSSFGYGKPKASSVIELDDLPSTHGDKGHPRLKHHSFRKNQQEYQHTLDHDSKGSHGGHKHVLHRHVHHHLHSVASTSASPSSIFSKVKRCTLKVLLTPYR